MTAAAPLSVRPLGAIAPEEGTGPPLVLLHAFPLDSRMWAPVTDQLARLAPGLAVVLVDAPGFGASQVRAGGLDVAATGVLDALGELRVRRAVVAGLSMGGYLAMALAERAPHLVAGIGLLNTKSSADGAEARERRLRMASTAERGEDPAVGAMADALVGETTRRDRPAVLAHVRALLAQAPAPGIVWAQRAMAARPDRTSALASLGGSVAALVLHGGEDSLMSDADAELMAQALGTDVLTLSDVGHLSALEDPVGVAHALLELHRRSR